MNRPWVIWSVFLLCLIVGLTAMGWISATIIRLDRDEAAARRQAAYEERVRLALWRMESALAPIAAQENARPYFHYQSFYSPTRAYTRMFAEIQAKELLLPSPLLTFSSPYIVLHFQLGPNGQLTSPQVPLGNMRDLAESRYTSAEVIQKSVEQLAALEKRVDLHFLLQKEHFVGQQIEEGFGDAAPFAQQLANKQTFNNILEADAGRRAEQQRSVVSNMAQQKAETPTGDFLEGMMQPGWYADTLLLVRRVVVNGDAYLQGCRMNWSAIESWLQQEIADLLPNAQLDPAPVWGPQPAALQLATLPVKLVPGSIPVLDAAATSPIRMALLFAWIGFLLAAVAALILLKGAISLSERRGAFVSAVTHELRTPLTTFRLYADLLAEDKFHDEEKRRRALGRLRSEADRLGHLIQNVLAYAQLERGRDVRHMELLNMATLFERIKDRLEEVAARGEMEIAWKNECPQARLRVDTSIVEQILLNLVDNACKYAAVATDRRIHLRAARQGERVVLRLRDHGPGLSADMAGRLFRPFSKSAHEAAHSAPGVGLGLALSRQLARRLGGELELDRTTPDGACFILTFPLVSS